MKREYRESCVSLKEVKRGSVGLKCRGCLKLCPPCNPHLVTTACDTVLKSKPVLSVSLPLLCVRSQRSDSQPTPPPYPTLLRDGSIQFVAAGFRPSRTWHSLTDCSLASYRPDITCAVRRPCEACVCSMLCILLVSILVANGELTEWCNPKVSSVYSRLITSGRYIQSWWSLFLSFWKLDLMLLMQKAEILEVQKADYIFTYTLSLSCLLQIVSVKQEGWIKCRWPQGWWKSKLWWERLDLFEESVLLQLFRLILRFNDLRFFYKATSK